MNNDYSQAVKQIASQYSGIVSSSGVFTGDEAAKLSRGIAEDVMPKLNFEKPRVLVYGIYNSGKSTLVNAICGQEVAQVANRPTTYEVDKYDAGKYILVDSPGIDAPHEHEVVADNEINSCHVILFVINPEGLQESETNYRKMWDIMKRNLPFIIVLNERAVEEDELQQHLADMNTMKRKVLENLERISGRQDIANKYDVIVLDAKLALAGILRNKKGMIRNSHISDLTNRIEHFLESEEAMKLFLAPLSALENQIGEGEKMLISKTSNSDYALKRETLQQKISQFTQSFQDGLRYSAERYFDEIYQGYLGASVDMGQIYNAICSDAEENYKRSSAPLINYIRTNFSALDINVDNQGRVTLNTPREEMEGGKKDFRDSDDDYNNSGSSAEMSWGEVFSSVGDSLLKGSGTAAGAAIGAALGSFVPVIGTLTGGAIGGALGKVGEILIDIFSKKAKREREEYERRRREVDAYNRREEQRAEEENRRRQSARVAATNQINAIIRDLRSSYGDVIEMNFNRVMQLIDEAIARVSKGNARIQQTLEDLKGLRVQIQDIRRKISY